MVAGRVLRHGALETDLDARVGARLPFFEQRLVGDGQLEQVLGLVPLGVVLGFRDHLAGREVHHLDGLLVRGQVLVIRVGERDLADRVGEACGQVGLGGQLVFDLLAGVDDLAVHARLVAALGPFADHVLDDGRHVAADLRLVGLLDGPVQGLRAAVRQARAVRAGRVAGRGAERQLVAGLLAEVLAHLACALAGREADRAGDEQRDLLGSFQSFQAGQVLLVRGGGGLRAGDGDRPLGGHVLARVHDVRDTGLLVGRRVRLVHAHGFHVVRLEDVGGLRPIVRQGELGGRLGEVGADGAVDHGAYLVAVEEHVVVRARLVRLVRVDDRGPLAVLVEDPALVRVRLERGELARFGVHGRVLVPRVVGLVLDRIALGLGDGHVEAELQRVLVGHEPALPDGAHRVRLLVEADGPLCAHVLVVVGRVDELEIVDRVGDALRVDHVADRGPVAARARVEPDGGTVGHAVRARARRDRLMGLVGRYGLERERLRRLTVGRVHGRAHVALLGDLHVEPVRALGPAFLHAEVGGRERGAVHRPGGRHGHALRGFRGLVQSCRVAVVVQGHVGVDVRAIPPAGRGDHVMHGRVRADCGAVRRGLRGDAQRVGGHAARLVLVEHDDRDRGPARVSEHLLRELVDCHRLLITKGLSGRIFGSIVAPCISIGNLVVPVVMPVRACRGGDTLIRPLVVRRLVGHEADAHDTAVRPASLIRVRLVETGRALRLRLVQRLGRIRVRRTRRIPLDARGHDGLLHGRQVRTPTAVVVVLVRPALPEVAAAVTAATTGRTRAAAREREHAAAREHRAHGQQRGRTREQAAALAPDRRDALMTAAFKPIHVETHTGLPSLSHPARARIRKQRGRGSGSLPHSIGVYARNGKDMKGLRTHGMGTRP